MTDDSKLINLSVEKRTELIIKLVQNQIIDQRIELNFFKDLTDQPAQIDTGYIAQHLVSLITGIKGGGFRGKGLDLADGSEVKGANFLDSLDRSGAVAPRWNFQCNNIQTMEEFLTYTAIYLVSIDLTIDNRIRIRVWKVDPRVHVALNTRYVEWMETLGKPKLLDEKRPGINFQLFPPRIATDETFARHGNGRSNGFSKLKIELEEDLGSELIFHAESSINDELEVLFLMPH